MATYRMSQALYNELLHSAGARYADWYRVNWERWVTAGSLVAKSEVNHDRDYTAPVINPKPNPISPEQEAEHERIQEWAKERIAAAASCRAIVPYREPCRAIVPYREPVAVMPPLTVSLWHAAMAA